MCRLRINQDEESNDESNGDSDYEPDDPQHTCDETHFLFIFRWKAWRSEKMREELKEWKSQ